MELIPFKSLDDLKKIQKETYRKINLRLKESNVEKEMSKHHILVCAGTGCISSESNMVREKLKIEIKKEN